MCKSLLLTISICLFIGTAFGQSGKERNPLRIATAKILDSADLASKEPGWHLEPLPQVGYESLTGLSFGAIGSLFNNGQRNDSLYKFANYKFRLDFAAGGSYRAGQQGLFDGDDQLFLKFDAPFVYGSRFRLSGEVNLENSPYNLYYGTTTASLRSLVDLSQPGNERYNYFVQKERLANVKAEYMLFNGYLWPFIGLQFMDEQMSAEQNSLISHDVQGQVISGFGHTQTVYLRSGIKYDSRNNADNPSKGVFAELTDEYAPKLGLTGSAFNKFFFHLNYYVTLNKSGVKPFANFKTPRIFGPRDSVQRKVNDLHFGWFSQNIMAIRYALGSVTGNAPFYAYQSAWASDDNVAVLGGDNDLRGFNESRFAGPVISFINVELRASILKVRDNNMTAGAEKNLPAQKVTDHYDIALVPFFDLGGVWDKFGNYFQQYNNHYKCSGGLGARLTLNSDFVIRYDYAVSSENQLSILTLSHTF